MKPCNGFWETLTIGDAGKPAYDFLSHKSMNSLTDVGTFGTCPVTFIRHAFALKTPIVVGLW